MGTLIANTCIITGLPVIQNFVTDQLGYDYKINILGREQIISLPADFEIDYSEYLQENGHLLKGLLYNGIWIKGAQQINKALLDTLISQNSYPKNPQEKIDALLVHIFHLRKFDGEELFLNDIKFLDQFGSWNKLYFKNITEVEFYLKELNSLRLADIRFNADGYPISFKVTLEGLKYVNRIIEGINSNICFVAMSFDESLNSIYYDGIKFAIETTGFVPLIIRDENLPSDVTINDGIIAGIKKSSFIIADFTQNKSGVYFEAGYALGRGLKVIYTCKNEDEETSKLHFDTNHYQHILWDDIDDLKNKLINKIVAFIKP